MKVKILENKYLNSLLLLMLVSAGVHMGILVCLALWTGDFYLLNYFNILDIDRLAGDVFNNGYGNALATAAAVGLYVIILKMNR